MRPYDSRTGINPITNTPFAYTVPQQQQQKNQKYYAPQYPQQQSSASQFAQQPSQTDGFNNTYYNQTLPQTISQQQRSLETQKAVQKPPQQLDSIELDHLSGFSGKHSDVIHLHPEKENTIIYAIAGLVVIENFNDKHQQMFLRGHDMDISSLAVSRTGRYIASGQVGTKFAKNCEAPIILWDFNNRKPIQVFRGLRSSVTNISFSDDEKFIAATSANNQMTIWNCQDYSVVHNKVLEVPISLITWCPPRKSSSKHSQYILITTQGPQILINILEFDVASMQYILKQSACQVPSTGLIRQYTKATIDQMGDFLYAGTATGEICIFSISTQGGIFKAAIPVTNNGVLNLKLYGKNLFISSGDGKVKKLSGSDTRWSLEREISLEGRIGSLTIDRSGRELLVGTSAGKIFRLISNSLDCTTHSEGHLSAIMGLSQSKSSNDIFATIDYEGIVMIWDLNDMIVLTRCIPASMNRIQGASVFLDYDKTVLSGWSDGFLRCHTPTNKPISPQKWEIINAHKGAITSIYSDQNYYLTGGEDGIIRVWSRSVRQLLTQISIHTKTVCKVFPDINKPNLIHSCSVDKTIHTYDLKIDKKVILHQAKNGCISDMTQRKDNEMELVTCGANMPIFFWDVDMIEPIDQIEPGFKLNTIEISPDGKLLAAGTDNGDLVLISLITQSVMGKFLGHSQGVSKVQWTSDQKQIITTGYDGTICLWNVFL